MKVDVMQMVYKKKKMLKVIVIDISISIQVFTPSPQPSSPLPSINKKEKKNAIWWWDLGTRNIKGKLHKPLLPHSYPSINTRTHSLSYGEWGELHAGMIKAGSKRDRCSHTTYISKSTGRKNSQANTFPTSRLLKGQRGTIINLNPFNQWPHFP